jgi:hypothetical protein
MAVTIQIDYDQTAMGIPPVTSVVFLIAKSSSSYPFPTLSGSVQHVFHHVVIKIRHLFLRPAAACLTSILLETGVGANDCSRDQRLNVPSEARRSSR